LTNRKIHINLWRFNLSLRLKGAILWWCCKFVLLFLLIFFSLRFCIFAETVDDPAASLNQQQETTSPLADNRYTAEAFAALSDDEKKNVYFNSPQLLPENFSSDQYRSIFHPELNNPGP
jgi:hypothetical protein